MNFVESLLEKSEPPKGQGSAPSKSKGPSRFRLVAEDAYEAMKAGDKERFLASFEAAVQLKKLESG